jgi:uncharacterized membrane protein
MSGGEEGAGEALDDGDVLHLRFITGLSLALLNCTLSSVGFVMQRWAHIYPEEQWANRLWIAGIVVYISAALPDVISYTLVPQIVCVAVACFRLVVVTVLAHIFLKDQAGRREWMGMLVVSVGTFLCLQFGPRPNEENIAEHVAEGSAEQDILHIYVAACLFILAILLAFEHHDFVGFKLDVGWRYFTLPMTTGIAFALGKAFNTELGLRIHGHSQEHNLRSLSVWWMGAMVAFCGLLDFYLNLRGAKVLPVPAFIPIVFAIGTSLQYLQSGFIFDEFSDIPRTSRGLSMLGAAMALLGAVLIRPPVVGCRGDEQAASLLSSEDSSDEGEDSDSSEEGKGGR